MISKHFRHLLACSFFLLSYLTVFAPVECQAAPVQADILLRGGTVIDGTGAPGKIADVAIRDGKIVAIGDLTDATAEQTIDCEGLIVAPGFIDLHNHSDRSVLNEDTRDARCYLTQGCTTLVTGNCGSGHVKVKRFYDRLEENGVGINVAHLLPNGALRNAVMGKVRRAPTEDELKQMEELTEKAMVEGAWGMTSGLQYVPSSYADTDELVAIATVVGKHGGFYASHIRDEGDELIESVEELLEIGRRANLPVHISHLKASKKRNWGKVRAVARLVELAQQQGVEVTADQYPYNASSTSIMAMLIPDAEREGGEQATAERMKDPAELSRLKPIIAEALEARGKLMIARYNGDQAWVGKTIHEVAALEDRGPLDIALEVLRDPGASGVNFGMDEADVEFVMTLPWVATASDGSSKIDDGTRPHPRSYGTFPRRIGYYTLEREVVPLEFAIRSATGLAAEILGVDDRGLVQEGLVADLVVFDPESFIDRATYEKPFEFSDGVRWLLVNGTLAIADGELQDVLAGQPLRRVSTHQPE